MLRFAISAFARSKRQHHVAAVIDRLAAYDNTTPTHNQLEAYARARGNPTLNSILSRPTPPRALLPSAPKHPPPTSSTHGLSRSWPAGSKPPSRPSRPKQPKLPVQPMQSKQPKAKLPARPKQHLQPKQPMQPPSLAMFRKAGKPVPEAWSKGLQARSKAAAIRSDRSSRFTEAMRTQSHNPPPPFAPVGKCHPEQDYSQWVPAPLTPPPGEWSAPPGVWHTSDLNRDDGPAEQ